MEACFRQEDTFHLERGCRRGNQTRFSQIGVYPTIEVDKQAYEYRRFLFRTWNGGRREELRCAKRRSYASERPLREKHNVP